MAARHDPRTPGSGTPAVRTLAGLLVPAGVGRPLTLLTVADSSVAISDLLGGVPLDDPAVWALNRSIGTATHAAVYAAVYAAEDRADLPANRRLCAVAARLGVVDRAFHAAARGDALILGTRTDRGLAVDLDVPGAVVAAAHRCGCSLLVTTPGWVPTPGAHRHRLRHPGVARTRLRCPNTPGGLTS